MSLIFDHFLRALAGAAEICFGWKFTGPRYSVAAIRFHRARRDYGLLLVISNQAH